MTYDPAPTMQRVMKKVAELPSGCWVWLGLRMSVGYGRIRDDGRDDGVHRVVYRYLVGEIPLGYEVDHLCRNPLCCNPQHLEAVTPHENKLRARAARRVCRNGLHEYDASIGRCLACKLEADRIRQRRYRQRQKQATA